jgi:hypothetical protein
MGSDEEEKKEKDVTELSPEEDLEEQNKAAAKIQAMHRGKKGRKKAKIIDEKNAKEADRKKNNPKIGEVATGGETSGLLEGGVGAANEAAAKAAQGSTEMMLKMFGKDGGAYMRTGDQRQCRDLPMCVSFAIYWICMLFLADYGWKNGNIDSLFYPVSFEGDACGVGDLEAYKSLYYPWVQLPEQNTCVSECPQGIQTDRDGNTRPGKYAVNGKVPPLMDPLAPFSSYICTSQIERQGRYAKNFQPGAHYAAPGDNYALSHCGESCFGIGEYEKCLPKQCIGGKGLIADGPCWHPYGETKNVLYQCIPTELAKNVSALLLEEVAGQVGSQHLSDMREFAWVIGVCAGVALVISFLWIIFLDHFAGPLIWCTLYTMVSLCVFA